MRYFQLKDQNGVILAVGTEADLYHCLKTYTGVPRTFAIVPFHPETPHVRHQ